MREAATTSSFQPGTGSFEQPPSDPHAARQDSSLMVRVGQAAMIVSGDPEILNPRDAKTFRDKQDHCIKIVLKPDGQGHPRYGANGRNGHGLEPL